MWRTTSGALTLSVPVVLAPNPGLVGFTQTDAGERLMVQPAATGDGFVEVLTTRFSTGGSGTVQYIAAVPIPPSRRAAA